MQTIPRGLYQCGNRGRRAQPGAGEGRRRGGLHEAIRVVERNNQCIDGIRRIWLQVETPSQRIGCTHSLGGVWRFQSLNRVVIV